MVEKNALFNQNTFYHVLEKLTLQRNKMKKSI